jgi:hypothetical protein
MISGVRASLNQGQEVTLRLSVVEPFQLKGGISSRDKKFGLVSRMSLIGVSFSVGQAILSASMKGSPIFSLI